MNTQLGSIKGRFSTIQRFLNRGSCSENDLFPDIMLDFYAGQIMRSKDLALMYEETLQNCRDLGEFFGEKNDKDLNLFNIRTNF